MSEDERTRLIRNIVNWMKPVEIEAIKERQICHFSKADPEYGRRIAEGPGLPVPENSL